MSNFLSSGIEPITCYSKAIIDWSNGIEFIIEERAFEWITCFSALSHFISKMNFIMKDMSLMSNIKNRSLSKYSSIVVSLLTQTCAKQLEWVDSNYSF